MGSKRSILVRFFLLLAGVCMIQVVHAQPGVRQIPAEFAGQSLRVTALHRSAQGQILVGSTNGVFRFDGLRFTPLHWANRTTSPADTVTTILVDSKQHIWLGMQSGRIARSTPLGLDYVSWEEGFPTQAITAILEDKMHRIWIATRGEGIYYYDQKRVYLVDDANGLTDLNVHDLALAGNGDVLAATDQGLNICRMIATGCQVRALGPSQGVPDYMITSLFAETPNRFWVGMQDKGFFFYEHPSGKITQPAATMGWNEGEVTRLRMTGNSLWLSTADSGLYRYQVTEQRLTRASHQKLHAGAIRFLETDLEGNVWSLVSASQLIQIPGDRLELISAYHSSRFSIIHALTVDPSGDLWLGGNGAILRVNPNTQATKRYYVSGLDSLTDITALYADAEDQLWVGTLGQGIFQLQRSTGKSRRITPFDSLQFTDVLHITASRNRVFVAGLQGGLAIDLSVRAGSSSKYSFKYFGKNSPIGSTYIYSIFEDSKQRIWFGTDGKGLVCLQPDGKYIVYNDPTKLLDDHVHAIAEDPFGSIWFSTAKAGIYTFDGSRFQHLGLEQGLTSLQIHNIHTDSRGHIIIAHHGGLDIYNPRTKSFYYLNMQNGLAPVCTDLGSVATDSKGSTLLVTEAGVVQVRSQQQDLPKVIPVIDAIDLFLNPQDTTRHVFAHDENNLTFHFSGLYYSLPEHVRFQYRLDGLDTAWLNTRDHVKSFPKLPPGRYEFRLRASISNQFADAMEVSWSFTIETPFWKRWWFIGLCVGFAIGILYLYVRWRESNFKRLQRLQQEKLHAQFQTLSSQVNPHFLFNSFNTLISVIEEQPAIAVRFVEHLADFFRDMLAYRDKDKITLADEWALLQHYIFLQQQRLGDGFVVRNEISPDMMMTLFIPPLTLQLLVENAIKHNAIQADAPIEIDITLTENNYLTVRNTKRAKRTPPPGAGMGLQNIRSRYALLTRREIEIVSTDSHFSVHVPLL